MGEAAIRDSGGSDKVAVFLDVENLVSWLNSDGAQKLLDYASAFGQVVVRRAYGPWTRPALQQHMADLNRAGFELLHAYHPVAGKNSADIYITVDAMEYVSRIADLRWIVLATGDSDFSPLFRRLREMGRQVVGIGPRSALSEVVKTSCTRFIYTDADAEPAAVEARAGLSGTTPATVTRPSGATAAGTSRERGDAFDLLGRCLQSAGGRMDCAGLKSRMLNLDPAFDENRLGYRAFLDFVRDAPNASVQQEGPVWFASLSDTADASRPALTPTTDLYSIWLKKKGWEIVERDLLLRVYRWLLANARDRTRVECVEDLVSAFGEHATRSELRDATDILFKTRVFEFRGPNEAGTSLFRAIELSDEELVERQDLALLCRLAGACNERSTEMDPTVAGALLAGEAARDRVASLVAEAHRQNAQRAA